MLSNVKFLMHLYSLISNYVSLMKYFLKFFHFEFSNLITSMKTCRRSINLLRNNTYISFRRSIYWKHLFIQYMLTEVPINQSNDLSLKYQKILHLKKCCISSIIHFAVSVLFIFHFREMFLKIWLDLYFILNLSINFY